MKMFLVFVHNHKYDISGAKVRNNCEYYTKTVLFFGGMHSALFRNSIHHYTTCGIIYYLCEADNGTDDEILFHNTSL